MRDTDRKDGAQVPRLYFGTPANNHGAYRGGLPRLIATKPLHDFWEVNRACGHGFFFDLPAGRTTLKRVRKRLGFHYIHDRTEFWTDRFEDLSSLSAREFAVKHGVHVDEVLDWRLRIVGKRARPLDWWRKPKVRKILLSELTLIKIGRKLDISTSHAKRLRDRAQQE